MTTMENKFIAQGNSDVKRFMSDMKTNPADVPLCLPIYAMMNHMYTLGIKKMQVGNIEYDLNIPPKITFKTSASKVEYQSMYLLFDYKTLCATTAQELAKVGDPVFCGWMDEYNKLLKDASLATDAYDPNLASFLRSKLGEMSVSLPDHVKMVSDTEIEYEMNEVFHISAKFTGNQVSTTLKIGIDKEPSANDAIKALQEAEAVNKFCKFHMLTFEAQGDPKERYDLVAKHRELIKKAGDIYNRHYKDTVQTLIDVKAVGSIL